MNLRRNALAVALLVQVTAACGEAKDGKQATPLRASDVYNVPLHQSAVPVPERTRPGQAVYRVALTVNGLANYYQVAGAGEKRPFRDLTWCAGSRTTAPAATFERVWQKPGTTDYLSLQAAADGPASLLTISDERGKTSRRCEPAAPAR